MLLQSLEYQNVGTCEINAKNMYWCIQTGKTNSQTNEPVSNYFLFSHAISHNYPWSVCSKHTSSTLYTLHTIRKCQNVLSEIRLPESGWLHVWVAVFLSHTECFLLFLQEDWILKDKAFQYFLNIIPRQTSITSMYL